MTIISEDLIRLTTREREVINLIAMGASAKEAAKALDIAPCTIERHIENARLKTRTRNRAHLIGYTVGRGLLQLTCMISGFALTATSELGAIM